MFIRKIKVCPQGDEYFITLSFFQYNSEVLIMLLTLLIYIYIFLYLLLIAKLILW
jgi:hypothetical protein